MPHALTLDDMSPRLRKVVGRASPRVTSTEEPDGGTLLVRIWRGAGVGNLPAYSTTAFSTARCSRRPRLARTAGLRQDGSGDGRLRGSSVGRVGRPQAWAPAGAGWQGVGGRGRVGLREKWLYFSYTLQLSGASVCSMRSRSHRRACAVNGSPLKTICFTCLRPCFWRYSVTFIQRMVPSDVRMTSISG
jgi:hypothetical protein